MSVKTILEGYHIPLNHFTAAIRFLNEQDRLEPVEYRARIQELSGMGDDVSDKMSRLVYLYLVQEIVRRMVKGKVVEDIKTTYGYAIESAEIFAKKNPYIFAKSSTQVVNPETGEVKKKKGWKRDLVKKIYAKRKDENLTRKQWIAILVEEASMTPQGASTYYHGLQTGKL